MAYRRSRRTVRRSSTFRGSKARRSTPRRASGRRTPNRGRSQTVRIVLETRADTLAPQTGQVLAAREVEPKKAKF